MLPWESAPESRLDAGFNFLVTDHEATLLVPRHKHDAFVGPTIELTANKINKTVHQRLRASTHLI